MAAGDILLDSEGNRILDADGNVMLSDGAGDACCCGASLQFTQARYCSDDTLSGYWISGAVASRTYGLRVEDGLCYYFDPADVVTDTSMPGTAFNGAAVTIADCDDPYCTPCNVCSDGSPSGVAINITGWTVCPGCFGATCWGWMNNPSGSLNGTYNLLPFGGSNCSWYLDIPLPVSFDYYDDGVPGVCSSLWDPQPAPRLQLSAQKNIFGTGWSYAVAISFVADGGGTCNVIVGSGFVDTAAGHCRGTYAMDNSSEPPCAAPGLFPSVGEQAFGTGAVGTLIVT